MLSTLQSEFENKSRMAITRTTPFGFQRMKIIESRERKGVSGIRIFAYNFSSCQHLKNYRFPSFDFRIPTRISIILRNQFTIFLGQPSFILLA